MIKDILKIQNPLILRKMLYNYVLYSNHSIKNALLTNLNLDYYTVCNILSLCMRFNILEKSTFPPSGKNKYTRYIQTNFIEKVLNTYIYSFIYEGVLWIHSYLPSGACKINYSINISSEDKTPTASKVVYCTRAIYNERLGYSILLNSP